MPTVRYLALLALGCFFLALCGQAEASYTSASDGKILYQKTVSGSPHMFSANTDGSSATDLGAGEQPVYSHDGSKIAFAYGWTIYVANADGSSRTALSSGSYSASPMWSPDDSQLAYTSSNYMYIINADGSGSRTYRSASPCSGSVDRPDWSPDGTKLIFDCYSSYRTAIYTTPVSSGSATKIIGSSGIDADNARWSPSGNQITYESRINTGTPSDFDVFVAKADGTGAVNLTPNGTAQDRYPTWSSNGSTLLFSSDLSSTGYTAVYRMGADGNNPTPLTTPAYTNPADWPSDSWSNLKASGRLHYVALGDSVASGEGLNYGFTWNNGTASWNGPAVASPLWVPLTDTSAGVQACHRSYGGYPYLLAQAENFQLTDLACSGSSAINGILDDHDFGGGTTGAAQLGTHDNSYAAASTAYDNATPDIVTLTVGANDVHFADFVKECYTPATSCENVNNDDEIEGLLSEEEDNLDKVLTELESRGDTTGHMPTIFVTNYYDPLPATYDGGCEDLVPSGLIGGGMSNAEFDWLKDKLAELNENIENEVLLHDDIAQLVDTDGAIEGHRWCSSDPWVYGASIDADPFGTFYPAPFHPTAQGQRAISEAVAEEIGG